MADAERPLLRVVRADPSPEELAALVAVLAAAGRAAPAAPAGGRARGDWADHAAALRRPLAAGPGAWRAVGNVPGTRTKAGT